MDLHGLSFSYCGLGYRRPRGGGKKVNSESEDLVGLLLDCSLNRCKIGIQLERAQAHPYHRY
jgi:hypothetical protein